MRLFVGGLSLQTSRIDLEDRLSKYGRISEIYIPECRTYAFVELEFGTDADKKRCFTTLNNSVWKGGRLKLEAAKSCKYETPEADAGQIKATKVKRNLVRHADGEQECPTEKNLDKKRKDWWYRSKYGRPVAIMKMRRPGGALVTIDPSHYKDRYEKLFGSEKPKPYSKLTWFFNTNSSADQARIDDSSSEEDTKSEQTAAEQHAAPAQEASVVSQEKKELDISELLYNVSTIEPLGIFYRSKPLEELRFEWVKQRSELRKDFRRRLKQSKRLDRKRQNI